MNPGSSVMAVAQIEKPQTANAINSAHRPIHCGLDMAADSNDPLHPEPSSVAISLASRGCDDGGTNSPLCAARYFAKTSPQFGHSDGDVD